MEWSRNMPRSRGFTLLEVMVAIGLMGIIMSLVWSTTSQSLRTKDRIEGRDQLFHSGEIALRKISDDISVAFLTTAAAANSGASTTGGTTSSTTAAPPLTPSPTLSTPTTAAPLTDLFKTFFIGEDRGDQDAIRFSSLSHIRLVKDSKEADQCRIAYEMIPDPEDTHLFNLVRREEPWLDMTTDVKADPLTLAEGVSKFNIEYYDDKRGDWVKEWSTEKVDWKDKLPFAVRITIEFPDPDDEKKTVPISTAVVLPLAAGPINQ